MPNAIMFCYIIHYSINNVTIKNDIMYSLNMINCPQNCTTECVSTLYNLKHSLKKSKSNKYKIYVHYTHGFKFSRFFIHFYGCHAFVPNSLLKKGFLILDTRIYLTVCKSNTNLLKFIETVQAKQQAQIDKLFNFNLQNGLYLT